MWKKIKYAKLKVYIFTQKHLKVVACIFIQPLLIQHFLELPISATHIIASFLGMFLVTLHTYRDSLLAKQRKLCEHRDSVCEQQYYFHKF